MRIAHLIIAHKNPGQLERLINKMQHSGFDFFIHIDKKSDFSDFSYLATIDNVYFIKNRVICNWGGYSTLKAMTNSLKEAFETDVHYDFYNLLSAQDYPLKTNLEIAHFLQANKDKSFLFYETANAPAWWAKGANRYKKYHLTDYNFFGKSILERILNIVLPERKFPLQMEMYGGSKSSWWTLNYTSAAYLIAFLEKSVSLGKFLKYCWGADEFVIPSILMNSPLRSNIVNNNLRYIHFPTGQANPSILDMEDFNQLIASDMYFARKFDIPKSSDLLDKIDSIS